MKNTNQSKWQMILKVALAVITALLGIAGGAALGL